MTFMLKKTKLVWFILEPICHRNNSKEMMKYSNNVNLFDQSNHWGVDQIQARANCNNCGHGADVLPGTCTRKTSKLPKIHLV